MTVVVGLTGGIGSGKTTVARLFNDLGVPIYFADQEAKAIMSRSKVIKRKLIQAFGEETYINGELNRPYLAKLVFNDKEKLTFLESVVHPKVNQHFKRWVKKQKYRYVMQENAILFENGSHTLFDYIITVTAPLETKIERVIKRDGVTKEMVEDRMKNQWTDKEKIKRSDFIIENIDLKKVKKEVTKIHKKILKICKD